MDQTATELATLLRRPVVYKQIASAEQRDVAGFDSSFVTVIELFVESGRPQV